MKDEVGDVILDRLLAIRAAKPKSIPLRATH
jgi:hypothetical protein